MKNMKHIITRLRHYVIIYYIIPSLREHVNTSLRQYVVTQKNRNVKPALQRCVAKASPHRATSLIMATRRLAWLCRDDLMTLALTY